MGRTTLITGGAGYIGMLVAEECSRYRMTSACSTRACTASAAARTGCASRATTVPEGIREIVGALEEEWFEDVFDGRYRNVA